MRTLNRLIKVSALAAVVLLGHPDTASAQLTFSPASPVALSISGPGATTSQAMTVSSSSTTISSMFVTAINTSNNGNWLSTDPSGQFSGNSFTLRVNNTSGLVTGQTYTGT